MADYDVSSELDEVERECRDVLALLELPESADVESSSPPTPPLEDQPAETPERTSPTRALRLADRIQPTLADRLDKAIRETQLSRRPKSPPVTTTRLAERVSRRTYYGEQDQELDPNIVDALPLEPGKLVTLSTGQSIDPCTLFIQTVDSNCSPAFLEDYFSSFGRVINSRFKTRQSGPPYGLVTMSDPQSALAAKLATHRKILGQTACWITFSDTESVCVTHRPRAERNKRPPTSPTPTPPPQPISHASTNISPRVFEHEETLYIEPVHHTWSASQIHRHFSTYGLVLEVQVKEKSERLAHAFVLFASHVQAQDALSALDGSVAYGFHTRRLVVRRANHQPNKSNKRPREPDAERGGHDLAESPKTKRRSGPAPRSHTGRMRMDEI